jgi:hypothetical protein
MARLDGLVWRGKGSLAGLSLITFWKITESLSYVLESR